VLPRATVAKLLKKLEFIIRKSTSPKVTSPNSFSINFL